VAVMELSVQSRFEKGGDFLVLLREFRGQSIFQSKNDPEIDFGFQYKMIPKIK
jgi:hypothetical protein